MDELALSPPPPPLRPVSPPNNRRITLAAGLALLWGIFVLLVQFSGALDTLEEPLLDWKQTLSFSGAPRSDQLALIAIDTIPADRPWPWSRLDYSLVLRSLIDYTPQSVVFEMPLNDHDTEFTSFDDIFSHVVGRAPTVIFGATLMAPLHLNEPLPQVQALSVRGDTHFIPRYSSVLWPLQTFAGHSPIGVNNVESEDGLHLRSIPLVLSLRGKVIPSLVLQAVSSALEADLSTSEIVIGHAVYLRRTDGRLLRTIPIDREGRMRIRYRNGPVASSQISFENILLFDDMVQHGLRPDRDLRVLAKRQIWIGRTDAGDRVHFQTPAGRLSRTEVELQAERTILDQDYVRPLPPIILALVYLLTAIVGAVLLTRLETVPAMAVFLLTAIFWFESSLLAFRLFNVLLPLLSFAVLLIGAYFIGLLSLLWDLKVEDKAARPR